MAMQNPPPSRNMIPHGIFSVKSVHDIRGATFFMCLEVESPGHVFTKKPKMRIRLRIKLIKLPFLAQKLLNSLHAG